MYRNIFSCSLEGPPPSLLAPGDGAECPRKQPELQPGNAGASVHVPGVTGSRGLAPHLNPISVFGRRGGV